MILFWLALTLFVLLSVASMIVAIRRGLAFYRDFKRLTRGLGKELDGIARSTAEIDLHVQAAAASGTALESSLARLRKSRAELAVSTSALADVRASFGRIASVVPRSK
ncbi:MAG: hypothetical protein H0V94_10430 [Actinobacteria bacterium]|nr:hypothetical protein [Actinomycetota bacterium]